MRDDRIVCLPIYINKYTYIYICHTASNGSNSTCTAPSFIYCIATARKVSSRTGDLSKTLILFPLKQPVCLLLSVLAQKNPVSSIQHTCNSAVLRAETVHHLCSFETELVTTLFLIFRTLLCSNSFNHCNWNLAVLYLALFHCLIKFHLRNLIFWIWEEHLKSLWTLHFCSFLNLVEIWLWILF